MPEPLKVILTGATGMVGEGVLLECLDNPAVAEVLIVTRKPYAGSHPKLKQAIAPDFMDLNQIASQLSGYDACLFCAGVSSADLAKPTTPASPTTPPCTSPKRSPLSIRR